jgi:YidC/Oxa1 family membrane protein insertase
VDFQRLLLFVIFSTSVFMLWNEWERYQHPAAPAVAAASGVPAAPTLDASAPAGTASAATTPGTALAQLPDGEATGKIGKKITVTTDFFKAEINTLGGNLQRLELLQQQGTENDKHFGLLERHQDHVYLAQSGLIGKGLPNHYAEFTSADDNVTLAEGRDSVQVKLEAAAADGAKVTKIYTFHRGSYLIDVAYQIDNTTRAPITGDAYFQLQRADFKPAGEARFLPVFTGPAVYSEEGKLQKISFSDVEKNKANFVQKAKDGWVGMLQHYFVAAWLPKAGEERENYMHPLPNNQYSAGVVVALPTIAPGATGTTSMALYAGPAQTSLESLAPGLGLSVDYGMMTPIAKPMFLLLKTLHGWVGNWGVAIILLTLLVKLVLFPVSAAGFRSMAKMRVVAPKLAKIKEQYADDRERQHKAMMELYKTEKINPVGGCLPILVQMPIFLSLYDSILSSVELRHAPFVGWIADLSSPDPWFVLPALMAGTMLLQTKLNPAPADPMQAKIMQTMPIVFGVMFFFFPAGLVLYSVVNSGLSILQQWVITRSLAKVQA